MSSIATLVDRFSARGLFSRTDSASSIWVHQEFVLPLFELMGWDLWNERKGSDTRAPDYSLRIDGSRKCFVKISDPGAYLREDDVAALQLRRYGWSAALPLSILTNFREFAVYDCRVRPEPGDKAATGRLLYLTHSQLPEYWSQLDAIFSRAAVLRGSLGRFAERSGRRRSRHEVDMALLQEIEQWRELLARHIYRYRTMSDSELNSAVQTTIDRLLFLRLCEERGVGWSGHWSGMFEGDEQLLQMILERLYDVQSPYRFSVMPAHVLGQVYEQFLGRAVHMAPDHQIRIEEKPEVRKAGGIYYTPVHVVQYMVRQTVGQWLHGKTALQVGGESKGPHSAPMRILDPACGAGSFLLGAYEYLLNWYCNWYVNNGPERWARGPGSRLYRDQSGRWRLTVGEKRRILTNHIYGVDIDPHAVRVTRLSLLLMALEEGADDATRQQAVLHPEWTMPDLMQNIKCGNSLISSDFYASQQIEQQDSFAQQRLRTFDWRSEFPEAIQAGGFDVILGNPPYISFGLRDAGKLAEAESDYYRAKFAHSAEYKISMYAMFMQLAIDLTSGSGWISFIVPDSFLSGRYFSKIRRYMLDTCAIRELLLVRARIFARANVGQSVIFALQKSGNVMERQRNQVRAGLCDDAVQLAAGDCPTTTYSQTCFEALAHNRFRLFFDERERRFVDLVEAVPSVPLRQVLRLSSGLIGKRGQESIVATAPHDASWKPGILSGEEVNRYAVRHHGGFICFDQRTLKSGFRNAVYDAPKLFGRQTGDRLIWAYDPHGLLCLNNLHVGNLTDPSYHLFYLLGILNSQLMNRYYQLISLEAGRALAQTDIETLGLLPVRTIDRADDGARRLHDRIAILVGEMIALHDALGAERRAAERAVIEQRITAHDDEIDRIVYQLYDLLPEKS